MKKTFTVLFLGIGLFSIPFSYCSTTTTASTSSAGSGLATHDPDRAPAIEDANSHWYDIRPLLLVYSSYQAWLYAAPQCVIWQI
jgi:hypothetical protein